MHFPLHNSCRKCPTSSSQASTLVHSDLFPCHPPPTTMQPSGMPPILIHYLSSSLAIHSLCSTWRWKAQNKNTFETAGEWKAIATKQQLHLDKGRRQKLKLNTTTHHPLCHLPPTTTHYQFLGAKMQGKLYFWVEFQWPLQKPQRADGRSVGGHGWGWARERERSPGFSLIASSFLAWHKNASRQ